MERNKDGTGILFINSYRTNPKAPKYKGNIRIDGAVIKLAGWEMESMSGPCISLAIDNWDKEKGAVNTEKSYPREVRSKDDDDIPF